MASKYKPMPNVSQKDCFISRTFIDVDFRSLSREDAYRRIFCNCTFYNCNFEGVYFTDCAFMRCTFRDCNLKKTRWLKINMQDTVFTESALIYSSFESLCFSSIVFNKCSLRSSVFKKFEFFKVEFNGSLLYDAIFISGFFACSTIDPTTYDRGSDKLVTKPYKGAAFDHVEFHNSRFEYIDFNKINVSHCYFNYVDGFKFCKNTPYVPMTCPEKGSFVAYKKVLKRPRAYLSSENEMIAVLEIPADAKRSSGGGTRKCRCDKAKVVCFYDCHGDVLNEITEGYSAFDRSFVYRVGEYVTEKRFDDDRWETCSRGIHFFINLQEAINYSFT